MLTTWNLNKNLGKKEYTRMFGAHEGLTLSTNIYEMSTNSLRTLRVPLGENKNIPQDTVSYNTLCIQENN